MGSESIAHEAKGTELRHRTNINTEQFLNERQRYKLLGGLGAASLGNFWDFNSIKSSFLGFSVIQTGYWAVPFYSNEALQLGKFFFFIKNIFIMKNLTDFHKTGETGVDLRRPHHKTQMCHLL